MTEENKGQNQPENREKQNLEKNLLELFSSLPPEEIAGTEALPGKVTEKNKDEFTEVAQGPGKDISKELAGLFPQDIPMIEEKEEIPEIQKPPALPGLIGKPVEQVKARSEPPPATPLTATEVKIKQDSDTAISSPGSPVPSTSPKSEKPGQIEAAAGVASEKAIPLEEKVVSKSGGLLSGLFRPLKANTVCISLEGNYLRILSLKGDEVRKWLTVPVNPRSVRNGVIVNTVSWGEQLQSILEKEKIKAQNVYCALPAVSVTREFKFPKLSGTKLEEIINREARRVLSYSSESSILRWKQLDSRGLNIRVFVMLVPREPVINLVMGLNSAGLKPKFIELKPLSLIRALNAYDAIIAHGELNSLELSVVVSGEPRVLRSIYMGDALMPKEEATGRFINELARTLAFYNETYREEPLDITIPLYLTGELAMSSSLSNQIKALTGRPVAPVNINLSYPPSFPVLAYMVNIGLSMLKQ